MTNSPTMTENADAEALRQAGLKKVRSEEYGEAVALYDLALQAVDDADMRELIEINKADALIALGRTGPEVQQLASVLMRRRNHHHVFLAAYALMYKHRLEDDRKRCIFYGQVALEAAEGANEPFWKLSALNELGIIYECDSQFLKAIECFDQALSLVDSVVDTEKQQFSRAAIVQNLGYNKLLIGEIEQGVSLLRSVLGNVEGEGTLADAHLELCYGYLELKDLGRAKEHGKIGLAHATEQRQVRNAHYLLGEVAFESGDDAAVEYHFGELAQYYPEFRNLKSILIALNLRALVNFRL